MTYSVWCDGELIGGSELELPRSERGDRTGIFRPTTAFERVAPVFRRRQELVGRLAELALGRQAAAAPAQAMRSLLAQSGLGTALRESQRELQALRLEVRDDGGVALAPREINIFDVELLEPRDASEELKASLAAERAALGLDPARPNYVLQVLPLTEEPDDEAGWEPERAVG